jgi:hypothetical protein
MISTNSIFKALEMAVQLPQPARTVESQLDFESLIFLRSYLNILTNPFDQEKWHQNVDND